MDKDVYASFARELEDLDAKGLKRRLVLVEKRKGPWIRIGKRWYLNLASNDYLGLAQKGLDLEADDSLGLGAGASRLLAGNHRWYKELEDTLEDLYNRPALVFGSGYLANTGVVSALVGKQDAVFADKLVHASLIDGIRLSRATLYRFPHHDLDSLAWLLKKKRALHRRALIITESLFSMDGDIPDLPTLIALKEEYKALLLLDEAHAVGVFGPKGLGIAEELGLKAKVDLLVGTFGKALGSYGAFVITNKILQEYLLHRARSFIFSTALPTIVVARSLWGLKRAVMAQKERTHLRHLATKLRKHLRTIGLKVPSKGLASQSPIVPVIVGSNQAALKLARDLYQKGFFAPAIRPPTVPPHTARIRLSLTSDMDWDNLAPVIEIFKGQLKYSSP